MHLPSLDNWKSLIKYVGNGRVEPECSAESQPKVAQRASEARQIDNNGVENAIRPTAIGKKNWLFFEDADAGQRSAVIYTIIESCRRRGIDPHEYLRDVLTRITESTNWNVADLTPQKWAKNKIPLKKAA